MFCRDSPRQHRPETEGSGGKSERPVKERCILRKSLLMQPGHPGTETWAVLPLHRFSHVPHRGRLPSEVAMCAVQIIMKLRRDCTWSRGATVCPRRVLSLHVCVGSREPPGRGLRGRQCPAQVGAQLQGPILGLILGHNGLALAHLLTQFSHLRPQSCVLLL